MKYKSNNEENYKNEYKEVKLKIILFKKKMNTSSTYLSTYIDTLNLKKYLYIYLYIYL